MKGELGLLSGTAHLGFYFSAFGFEVEVSLRMVVKGVAQSSSATEFMPGYRVVDLIFEGITAKELYQIFLHVVSDDYNDIYIIVANVYEKRARVKDNHGSYLSSLF